MGAIEVNKGDGIKLEDSVEDRVGWNVGGWVEVVGERIEGGVGAAEFVRVDENDGEGDWEFNDSSKQKNNTKILFATI